MKSTLDQLARQMVGEENPINDNLRKLIHKGREVRAVKEARDTLGLSLAEGKEYVDALKREKRE
ncbi:hypothetical protein [Alteribacillus iranensis]|uniref:Uncharacterized protein n=1 Tax=Alteribacillus iranensis TaxID=930128 RepID=A0A1I1ZUK5_9BACI|nr:hypothetical protein [Alteribacillus iranensis]SFE35305.1 hypothetical protein SAMN05192532_101451 [Alteribacillus iranensis]